MELKPVSGQNVSVTGRIFRKIIFRNTEYNLPGDIFLMQDDRHDIGKIISNKRN